MIDVYEWHDPWSWLAIRQKETESAVKVHSSMLVDDEVREAFGLISDAAPAGPHHLRLAFTDRVKGLMVARGYQNIRSMPVGRRVEIVKAILREVQ